MERLDFRSDTITRPDEAMRHVIAQAEVGDDVFGDDPTVLHLQERVAGMLGTEDALFVPSGTMGNQIALALHTQPGDQIILEADSHIYHYEAGAAAALSGLWPTLVSAPGGALHWAQVEEVLNPDDVHKPRPALVCLENTHNRAGGAVVPLELIDEVAEGCHRRGLKLHLDGARLWNAAVATGIPLERWCRGVDTVSVCFSKGLGAPVGSCLLAAACLYALDHNLDRLAEDHENARLIAEGLDHPRLRVAVMPDTNILLIDLDEDIAADGFLHLLAERGVLGVAFGEHRIRLTTHKDVSREDCRRAVEILNGLEI